MDAAAAPEGGFRGSPADRAAERAQSLFESGLYCAESVLQAVAEIHAVMDPAIPRIATGFCGGVSRTAGMCGALAGGILALGLLAGRSSPQESNHPCYALTCELVQRFRTAFGSTQCAELLGCDISTPEGSARFREQGLLQSVCAPVTRQAAAIVAEVFALRDVLRHPLL